MMVSQSAPPASSPAPRLRARSMLSLGTEVFLAFWIASNSVGLPAGSPPPIRAATSTFLTSLANILPRLASFAAFLCLVVAHFEWPAIGQSLSLHEMSHLARPVRGRRCFGVCPPILGGAAGRGAHASVRRARPRGGRPHA